MLKSKVCDFVKIKKTHVGGDAKLQIAQQADSSESEKITRMTGINYRAFQTPMLERGIKRTLPHI